MSHRELFSNLRRLLRSGLLETDDDVCARAVVSNINAEPDREKIQPAEVIKIIR